MPSLAQTSTISASLRRSILQKPQVLAPSFQRRFASQGYGGGEGSGGAIKGTADGHSKAKQDFLRDQKRQFSTIRSMWKESKPKSTEGLSPKILNESPPPPEEESADVKKHNEEMANRSEKAHEQIGNEDAEKDKVSPKFWSGKYSPFWPIPCT
jgi:hypothetical protein